MNTAESWDDVMEGAMDAGRAVEACGERRLKVGDSIDIDGESLTLVRVAYVGMVNVNDPVRHILIGTFSGPHTTILLPVEEATG